MKAAEYFLVLYVIFVSLPGSSHVGGGVFIDSCSVSIHRSLTFIGSLQTCQHEAKSVGSFIRSLVVSCSETGPNHKSPDHNVMINTFISCTYLSPTIWSRDDES